MQKMTDWQYAPKSYLMPWLVLCASLAATIYAADAVRSNIENEAQLEFAVDCNEVKANIEARLQAHKQVLLGGAAMFDASESVNRDEWRKYAARMQIDQHFNGIQGLGYSLLIQKQQLPGHIAEIRKQGFTTYTVHPAGERESYSSIIYLEPFEGRNLRAFGYDMYSEPVRRAAMEQARDKNLPAISGKVVLMQESNENVQAGTLMYVPVYRKQVPINTVEQRRAALTGWVYSPFRMNDLLHGVLQSLHEPDSKHIHLEVYDGPLANAANLLYDSEAGAQKGIRTKKLLSLERRTDFNGHVWTLRFELVKGSMAGINYSKAWGTFTAGFATSLLLFFLMLSSLNTRRNAQRIAEELTTELRKRAATEHELNERLRLKSTALNSSANAMIIANADGIIEWVNPAFSRLSGYEPEEALGQNPKALVHSGKQDQFFYKQLWETILAGKAWHGELINRRKDGTLYNEEMTITPVTNDQGVITNFIALKQDITERKMTEAQIHNLAFYDALTTLPNRRLLDDRLSQAMAAGKRNNRYAALIFLDLDNFKPLNDTHGHVAGDLLLIEVAKRLKSCVREMDTVARFGGDEFVVLLSELTEDRAESAVQAGVIAEKIRSTLSAPYQLNLPQDNIAEPRTVEHHCTSSIGVALFIGQETSAEDALKRADLGMYQAKQGGRNTIHFCD